VTSADKSSAYSEMSGSEWSGRRVHLFDSMILRDKKLINRMEWEIIRDAKKIFGKNFISLFVEGSYGNHDFIKGYSDYDLLTFVKDINKIIILREWIHGNYF